MIALGESAAPLRRIYRCTGCGTLQLEGQHPTCDPVTVIRYRAALDVLGAYFSRRSR